MKVRASGGLFGVMHGWAWPLALGALVTAYCYVHYGFASMTGHVTGLVIGFALGPVPGEDVTSGFLGRK